MRIGFRGAFRYLLRHVLPSRESGDTPVVASSVLQQLVTIRTGKLVGPDSNPENRGKHSTLAASLRDGSPSKRDFWIVNHICGAFRDGAKREFVTGYNFDHDRLSRHRELSPCHTEGRWLTTSAMR